MSSSLGNAHRRPANTAMTRGFKVKLLAGVIAASLSSHAVAQTSWTGAGGNNQWATAGNWSTNVVPNAAGVQVQIVDGDPNINGKTITLSGTTALGSLGIGTSATTLNSATLSGARSPSTTRAAHRRFHCKAIARRPSIRRSLPPMH